MHAIRSSVQPQPSAVSAAHEAASVWLAQGSVVSTPQSQGAQAVPAGQAGQLQAAGGALAADELAEPLDPLPAPTVMVEVEPALQAQLQAGQASPAAQLGQLHVQVGAGALPLQPPVPPS